MTCLTVFHRVYRRHPLDTATPQHCNTITVTHCDTVTLHLVKPISNARGPHRLLLFTNILHSFLPSFLLFSGARGPHRLLEHAGGGGGSAAGWEASAHYIPGNTDHVHLPPRLLCGRVRLYPRRVHTYTAYSTPITNLLINTLV